LETLPGTRFCKGVILQHISTFVAELKDKLKIQEEAVQALSIQLKEKETELNQSYKQNASQAQ